jgi:hypothetical protein
MTLINRSELSFRRQESGKFLTSKGLFLLINFEGTVKALMGSGSQVSSLLFSLFCDIVADITRQSTGAKS